MSFGGLNISVSGMLASQVGLDVTSNNIANANTVGYSRREVSFVEGASNENSANQKLRLLTGVVVEGMDRVRNTFLDQQVRQQGSSLGKDGVVADLMIAMNDILGEPSDSGLSAKLNEFFQAASDLAANPELETAKTVFINSADALADVFNQVDTSISLLKDNLEAAPTGQIYTSTSELNQKLELLADVHKEALAVSNSGGSAGELEDRRDLLLDEISSLKDFNIIRGGNGQLSRLELEVNASQPVVNSTLGFSNYDSPIAALTAGNNSLDITVNNGSGTAIGPFTVNFEPNSSIRDVVDKINKTFRGAGGEGQIASVNTSGNLSLQTSLMDGSQNNSTAALTIGAGSTALAALGLSAGTTNGSDAETFTVLDSQGLHYKFEMEAGLNNVGSNPSKMHVVTNDIFETKIGTVENFSGELGGYYEMVNAEIPEMREELSNFAVSIMDSVNKVLQLGVTESGSQGSALFSGTTAGSMKVNTNVISNQALLSQGKTGAVSDGSIAQEVADLFFGSNNVISDFATAEKVFIDSDSAGVLQSKVAIIPGESITIHADGIVDDNGSAVNAGTNGFGGGSLVQFEFLNAAGAVIGTTQNFPASAGAPEDRVSYTGTVPAGAAFIAVRMNSASFNDNDISNNSGHFGVSIIQGGEDDSAGNLNTKMADIVGDFGTRGAVANAKEENSLSLFQSLDDRRQAIMGVSIEEEAANLIRFQNAFSANARVISTWNSIFDSILGIL